MYFSHQSSGGRGEYEIAGRSGSLSAVDLDDHGIRLDLGALGVKETDLIVSHQGGKRRVRRTSNTSPMIQRQIGSLLLLPASTRDRSKVSGGRPVVIEGRYTIDKIDFRVTNRTDGMVTVAPIRLVLTSSPVDSAEDITESIDFKQRLQQVQAVERTADRFPPGVATALHEHAEALASEVIGTKCEAAIRKLKTAISVELPHLYIPETDILPALYSFLGSGTLPLVDPTQVPADEVELRRRFTAQMRMQKSRGSDGAKFRKLLQDAYDSRCVFCGLRLPKNEVCAYPGVDAAHILPWAKYDLDVVQNGLILCKLHHWAFDQQVLVLTYSSDQYLVTLPHRARNVFASDLDTLDELERHVGCIPDERLPTESSMRPGLAFLTELYQVVPPEQI